MGAESPVQQDLSKVILKGIVHLSMAVILQAVLLFAAAGRLDWWAGWAYMTIYLGMILWSLLFVFPGNKGLMAERMSPGKNAKGWDKVLVVFLGIFYLCILLVSGLDARFQWSPPPNPAAQVLAASVLIAGFLFASWAMASNKFFSTIVRIQADRGHTVATGGPYRFVRHPGYAGMIVSILVIPVLLGSYPALLPAMLAAALLVLRTVLEDRTLKKELAGYSEYASHVRYRLLPFVW
jgi:protein-S-isoprenylcysteine O-methyltransferase Ste14